MIKCDDIVVCIAVLLPMQQFYITKVMMLVLSITVMCSYLCSVCLVCRVLNNVYFKGHLWFMAPMEHSPNGKGIMAPMEYSPMIYSPSGKIMFLWKILFQRGNGHGKRQKKYNIKYTYLLYLNLHESIPVDAKIKIA